MSAVAPLRIPLLSTVVTNGVTPAPLVAACQRQRSLEVYIRSIGTVSGGTVVIEDADWDPNGSEQPWTGTWNTVATIDLTTLGANAQLAQPISSLAYVRARLTQAIAGGGAIVVYLLGSQE